MARDDYSHPHYPNFKYTKQYKLVCKDFMSFLMAVAAYYMYTLILF